MKKSNTKRRGKQVSKKVELSDELKKINLKVAGIDIANSIHYTAVSPHLTKERIRNFSAFTADLYSMADWFSELGIVANPARRGKCGDGSYGHILAKFV